MFNLNFNYSLMTWSGIGAVISSLLLQNDLTVKDWSRPISPSVILQSVHQLAKKITYIFQKRRKVTKNWALITSILLEITLSQKNNSHKLQFVSETKTRLKQDNFYGHKSPRTNSPHQLSNHNWLSSRRDRPAGERAGLVGKTRPSSLRRRAGPGKWRPHRLYSQKTGFAGGDVYLLMLWGGRWKEEDHTQGSGR